MSYSGSSSLERGWKVLQDYVDDPNNSLVRKRLEQTVAVYHRGPDCDGEPRRRVCAGEIGWNWERAKRATERLVEVPSI